MVGFWFFETAFGYGTPSLKLTVAQAGLEPVILLQLLFEQLILLFKIKLPGEIECELLEAPVTELKPCHTFSRQTGSALLPTTLPGWVEPTFHLSADPKLTPT